MKAYEMTDLQLRQEYVALNETSYLLGTPDWDLRWELLKAELQKRGMEVPGNNPRETFGRMSDARLLASWRARQGENPEGPWYRACLAEIRRRGLAPSDLEVR